MEKKLKIYLQFIFLLLAVAASAEAFSETVLEDKVVFFKTWQERDAHCALVTGHASYCWDWGRYIIDGVEIGHQRIGYGNSAEQIGPDTYKVIRYTLVLRNPCPPNTRLDPDTGQCVGYRIAAFNSSEQNTCKLNPIEIGTGEKIQSEMDIPQVGNGQVFFERYYNSSAWGSKVWSNNYSKRLVAIDDTTAASDAKAISDSFPTQEDACIYGWDTVQNKLTDSWAKNSSTEFKDGMCYVVRSGGVKNQLPIMRFADFKLADDKRLVELFRPSGTNYLFQYHLSQGRYLGVNGVPGELQRAPTGGVAWRFISNTGVIEDYSADGKLISINTNGMVQTLTYDSNTGVLAQVQDSLGRKLTFTYTDGLLSSVTENNKTTSFIYNSLFILSDVKRPENTHRLYHYEDSLLPTYLTGITDERGIRYATWSYDAQGRAISSEHAGGAEKGTVVFNADGSTTLTDALNKQTIYRFDDVAGARRVVKVEGQPTANCVGANQDYTYTSQGWIASKTDWKGNKTTYLYNFKGQEISRTEAYGSPIAKTIKTEWHPTFNMKTKIIESDRETILIYDSNGLLLSQKTRWLTAQ